MKIGADINLAAELLSKGELVAIPTETVYGLAANGYDADAVLKIYRVKGRPQFNPLIVHTDSFEKISSFVMEFPDVLQKIAHKFWPGPLTVLLPKSKAIHDVVTAGLDHVAVRIPSHPLTLKLLSSLNFPLAAPSANLSGSISPTTAQHASKQLGNKISYILDGGKCAVGIESTIVSLNKNNKVEILRYGVITEQDIAGVIGYIPQKKYTNSIESPGLMKSHYAPIKPFILGKMNELLQTYKNKKVAVLSFKISHKSENICGQIILSEKGNLNEAAKNLFAAMHQLDASDADIIISEQVPNYGIGLAINDRLQRASV